MVAKISDLYRISRMSRDEAVEYINNDPDEIYDLIVLVAFRITDGWMKRHKRSEESKIR